MLTVLMVRLLLVAVAHRYVPLRLACPPPWHLAVVACAAVGSAEAVEAGNIAAAAGSDDGRSSCAGAADHNASGGDHMAEASGAPDAPAAAAALPPAV